MKSETLGAWSQLKRLTYIVDAQVPLQGPRMIKSVSGEFTVSSAGTSYEWARLLHLLNEVQIVSPEHILGPGGWVSI